MLTRNQNVNEINSISANVRVSPMPQPPSYDFATKNLEPIGNETLPPSYDSIQTRVQTVRRNFRLTVQNNAFPERYVNKPFGQKVVYIFLVLLFLAYFVLLPLFKIIIGLNSINECPLNTSIPYWLMIDGVFIVLLALSIFLFKYFDCSLMASVISLFLFSWLIRGSVWVYKAGDTVSFDPDDTQNYCDPVCFHFAFWSISVTWSIIGFIILFIIFVIVIQSCKK